MFPQMRRKRQQLSDEETAEILIRGTSGTLALNGNDGYPYAVPVSYVYTDGKIFFHSGKSGYKLECIKNNPKVSFCVIDRDEVIPDEYTTYFRSAIVFGKVSIIENDTEKFNACDKFAEKYRKGFDEERANSIRKEWNALNMFVIDIEQMTGKEAIELVRRREQK